MRKTKYKIQHLKCDVCGAQPARYMKLVDKLVCKKHFHEAIVKYGIAIGAIAGTITILLSIL